MESIHVGCVSASAPTRRMTRVLDFVEIAPRPPFPRVGTLRRWRHQQAEKLRLALRAPRSAIVSARGPLRFDEAMEKRLSWAIDAADALQAFAVVLPTPPDMTPGRRDRQLLERLAERLPRPEDRLWVWQPSGVWQAQEAYQLADALGLVCAFDPLQWPAPQQAEIYAHLLGLGVQARLGEGRLEQVLENVLAAPGRRAYVSLDSQHAVREGQRLKQLAQEALGTTPLDAHEGDVHEGDEDAVDDEEEVAFEAGDG